VSGARLRQQRRQDMFDLTSLLYNVKKVEFRCQQ
jgi:hypothetical protein